MPITFDWDNGLDAGQFVFVNNTTQSISYTDEGVTFTLSTSSIVGLASLQFGGTGAGFPFALGTESSFTPAPDVFTLTFVGSMPGLTRITGTALNPISIDLDRANGGGNWAVTFLGSTPGQNVTTNRGNFATNDVTGIVGSFSGIRFTPTGLARQLLLNSLTVNAVTCFCAGTRIATPGGEVPVEEMAEGDVISTVGGGTTTVRWLGTRFIDTQMTIPARVNPICITAGALGNTRDLYVSPDHAIALDGCLVNASALVNGDTIYRVEAMPRDGFTYYHIETDAHELILAEGVAAETYLPHGEDLSFDNQSTRTPRDLSEMDLPRIATADQRPGSLTARLTQRGLRAA